MSIKLITFLFFLMAVNYGCVKAKSPESDIKTVSTDDSSPVNEPQKVFKTSPPPKFYNLLTKKDIDFKGIVNDYSNFKSITIKTAVGFTKYSREELLDNDFVVSEHLPDHSGKYLIVVEEQNNFKSQFMVEL